MEVWGAGCEKCRVSGFGVWGFRSTSYGGFRIWGIKGVPLLWLGSWGFWEGPGLREDSPPSSEAGLFLVSV